MNIFDNENNKQRQYRRESRAFTLIETLVVVAIISIVISILVPVFAHVREKGRQTMCLSNERQIGLAIMAYVADYDDVFPSGNGSPGKGWAGQCYPYLKEQAVFTCPDEGRTITRDAIRVSYGYNANLGADQKIRCSLSALTSLPRTVLLFEVSDAVANISQANKDQSSPVGTGFDTSGLFGAQGRGGIFPDGIGDGSMPYPLYATGNMGGRILNANGSHPRHGKDANYLLCDGHVRAYRPEQASSGQTARDTTAPQTDLTAAGTANPDYQSTFSVK